MTYRLHFGRNDSVEAADILAALPDVEGTAYLRRELRRLLESGTRYSNEDSDLLGQAWDRLPAAERHRLRPASAPTASRSTPAPIAPVDLDALEDEDTAHDGATRYAITRRLRDDTDEALRVGNLQAAGELTKRLVAYIARQTKAGPYRRDDGDEHDIEDMIGPDGCAPRRRYSVAVRGIVRELRALDPEAAAAAACWARDPYAGEVTPVVVTDLQTGITTRWSVAPRVTWEPRPDDDDQGKG